MPYVKDGYIAFYLCGRDEKLTRLRKEISVEELAEDAKTSDKSIYQMVHEKAESAAAPLRSGIPRQRWLEEHAESIKECGGDSSSAYEAFLKGRIDELACSLEADVINAWDDEYSDDDDEEEDDDDDDETEH